jgi:hypothetical protein
MPRHHVTSSAKRIEQADKAGQHRADKPTSPSLLGIETEHENKPAVAHRQLPPHTWPAIFQDRKKSWQNYVFF